MLFQLWEIAGNPVSNTQLGKWYKQKSKILNGSEGAQFGGVQCIGIEPKDIDVAKYHPDVGKKRGLYALLGYFTHGRIFIKKIGNSMNPRFGVYPLAHLSQPGLVFGAKKNFLTR